MEKNWYNLSVDETAKKLNTNVESGLSNEGVKKSREKYGLNELKKDDKIVLSIMEHHSNLVPWQFVSKKCGCSLEYMYVNDEGELTDEEIESKIVPGVKLVGITQTSNVLGTINDVKKITKRAHEVGAIVVVDGAQSVPHMKVDFKDSNIDFLSFSGHKMCGPTGLGVLYGKFDLLCKIKQNVPSSWQRYIKYVGQRFVAD